MSTDDVREVGQPEWLPEGWIDTFLSTLFYVSKTKLEPPFSKRIKYIGLENIKSGVNTLEGFSDAEKVLSTKNYFESGDILYGRLRPYLNKVYLAEFDGICSTDIAVLKNHDHISKKYGVWVLSNSGVVNYANHNMTGISLPRISLNKLLEFKIAIPPLSEQKRIVARIDELFSLVDDAKEKLEKTIDILENQNKAILTKAFKGELVPTEAELARKENRKPEKVEINPSGEVEQPEWLPEGWIHVPFDDITINFDNRRIPIKSTDRENISGIYPYYGASGIIDHVNDYIFEGKYLLIAEDGANLLTRTKPIAFIADDKFWVNNHAHIIRTKIGVDMDFLKHYINSLDISDYVTGSAQPKLTKSNLNTVCINFPSFSEQKRIVAKIEELTSKNNLMLDKLRNTLNILDGLKETILTKAFKGELVPTEAELARRENRPFEPVRVLEPKTTKSKTKTKR